MSAAAPLPPTSSETDEPTTGDRLRNIAWTILDRVPDLEPATMHDALAAAEQLFEWAEEEDERVEEEAERE